MEGSPPRERFGAGRDNAPSQLPWKWWCRRRMRPRAASLHGGRDVPQRRRDWRRVLLQGRWHWPNAAACERAQRRTGSLGGYRPSLVLSQASCLHFIPEHLLVSPPLSDSLTGFLPARLEKLSWPSCAERELFCRRNSAHEERRR